MNLFKMIMLVKGQLLGWSMMALSVHLNVFHIAFCQKVP